MLNSQFFLKNRSGFLLIELLIALAILSGLLLVVSSQVTENFRWRREAQLRLYALNSAISVLDKIVKQKKINALYKQKSKGITVSVQPVSISLEQKQNKNTDLLQTYKTVSVKAEWTGLTGKKEKIQLITGVLFDGQA